LIKKRTKAMKRILSWSSVILVVLVAVGLVVRSHYVLDSQELAAAIRKTLPRGTPKANVIQFIRTRKPVFWDDLGTHVKARMTGRARNLVYRKDIVLDFEFDTDGRLLSFSKTEYLTGL
jgi:hypothetical protein